MKDVEAGSSLTMELESGRPSLTLIREVGVIRDFLSPQNIHFIIRGNPGLRYINRAERRVAVCFRSERGFLSTSKCTRKKDAASDCLPEASWRCEALYPHPLGEQYMEVVKDISGHSIEHVSLLASGAWHRESNPGRSVVSQLERGKKLQFFTTRTREKTLCRKRIVPPLERLRSLTKTLPDDLLQFREHIVYCIHAPDDVVLLSLTAHCVLTGPGPAREFKLIPKQYPSNSNYCNSNSNFFYPKNQSQTQIQTFFDSNSKFCLVDIKLELRNYLKLSVTFFWNTFFEKNSSNPVNARVVRNLKFWILVKPLYTVITTSVLP